MRIIHICQRDDPDIGGSLRVAEALVREQRQEGVEAWLIFLYGPPSFVADDLNPYVICLGLESSRQALQGAYRLRRAIRRIHPDIIHSHDGIFWPKIIFLFLRYPIIMHAHLPAEVSQRRILWRLICQTTDLLIGISRPTISSWIDAGFPSEKIHFIPNGVDLDRFHAVSQEERYLLREKLGLPQDKKILLWLGRLHRSMKGSDRIEKISFIIPEDTVLVVVGYGPSYDELQAHCADLLEDERMIMTGTMSQPQECYAAADAFLFTSHYEPFGLVILEAVASGLPLLAFPLDLGGGASELLNEFNAYTLEDDDLNADTVRRALDVVLSRQSGAQESRKVLKNNYAWKNKSQDIIGVYRELLRLPGPLQVDQPRVLVCQHGARHRYAIPRIFDGAGMLTALYTDSSAVSHVGQLVKLLGDHVPPSWRSFTRWKIEGVSKSRIHSSDASFYYELFQRFRQREKRGIQLYLQRHRILSTRMKAWGLDGANIVYSMYHENLSFIRWAKDHGAKSVVDVFVSPQTSDVVEVEGRILPDWAEDVDSMSMEYERILWRETAAVADLLLCPSEWVAEGVRRTTPASAHKIKVVPYGCSINYEGRSSEPVQGHVLFAGRDPLRKGLHYLAQAATQLKGLLPELDVRVAGEISSAIQNNTLCRDIHFLGQLESGQMKEEFLKADVLVLPALSEGFAGVVAEAIAAGCPVIVTPESGSPIVHEREGLVVPSKNVDALADAIHRMVTDRTFRDQCSKACLEQVPFYSEERWSERLRNALEDLIDA